MQAASFEYQLAQFIDFRDREACARVARLEGPDLLRHPNPRFAIRVIEDADDFYRSFAHDLVDRIRRARDEGRSFCAILPVGPTAQYEIAAAMINREGLTLHHVHTFNMDEWANDAGKSCPIGWPGSFQGAMWAGFFGKIRPELRPPESQIHFPLADSLVRYRAALQEIGGADVCYGGIGWGGHVAFWESHLGHEFAGDLDAYRAAGARLVELHPMTIMQTALDLGGDWSRVPPCATTIGPHELLSARHRSFWLGGGGSTWQRFIARLVAHGPVSEFVPGSLLQTVPTDFTLLGTVAQPVAD